MTDDQRRILALAMGTRRPMLGPGGRSGRALSFFFFSGLEHPDVEVVAARALI
jgi:hypothetical protein